MFEALIAAAALVGLALAALATLAGRRWARLPVGLGAGLLAATVAAGLAGLALHDRTGWLQLVPLLGLPVITVQLALRHLDWPGGLFVGALAVAAGTCLTAVLALSVGSSAPLLGLGLSGFIALEILAALLAVGFGHEVAVAVSTSHPEPRPPLGAAGYLPRVCLQVAAYQEPADILLETLRSLARLNYPDYAVQVIVNNTTDPGLLARVELACRQLGPRFRFLDLGDAARQKAEALNLATRRLEPEVELVAVVDADFVVAPDFLAACVPHLADPRVAYVQVAQDFRDWQDSAYLRGLYHAYRYFFEISLVARSRAGAVTFGGSMGVVRLTALREVGGWSEWCVTEDAETSLRMLGAGWKSVYLNRSFGAGLMPIDFGGLRHQRYRWAFGAAQLLRRRLGLLIGAVPSRLTLAQRYHFALAALGWLGELLFAGLAVFLLIAAPLLALGYPLFLRPLTGLLLLMPLFLVVALARVLVGLKQVSGARWRDLPVAAVVAAATSWPAALGFLRGLFLKRPLYLRTRSAHSPAEVLNALLATPAESALAVAFVISTATLLARPHALTLAAAVLTGWQALAWASAPLAWLLARGTRPNPTRRLFAASPQSTGARPGARTAGTVLTAVAVVGLACALVLPLMSPASGFELDVRRVLGVPPGL
ncbi:MAG TPA: glycosyltransferase family 2 protein, partial [Candidatus Acidoferrales bacterium]|nr:glycosyltransferase family 2 protein [Candidatus Acidoferrales bacterium]